MRDMGVIIAGDVAVFCRDFDFVALAVHVECPIFLGLGGVGR